MISPKKNVDKTTNVLFYLEPKIEKGNPSWKKAWVPLYLKYIEELNRVASKRYRFFVIIGDAQQEYAPEFLKFTNVNLYIVQQGQLNSIYKKIELMQEQMYHNEYNQQRENLSSFYKQVLGDFVPDIVWSFVSPVPFFKDIFPGTLILNQELGMLGRSPVPLTWYLDPFGTFSNSLIVKFFNEICSLKVSRKESLFVEEIRSLYQGAIQRTNKIGRNDLDPKNEFEYLALLPLQYNGHFIFDALCDYESQFDLIVDVLEKTDKSIGVVVTEHKNPISEKVMTTDCVEYLKNKYSHFIYKPNLDRYTNSSLMILNVVDAVISVSSTLGMQGRFMGKALVSMGQSQLTPMASVEKLEDLYSYLEGELDESIDLTALYYFMLTRYYVPDKDYFTNGNWLNLLLIKLLNAHQSGKISPYDLPEIDTIKNLREFYRDNSMPKLIVHTIADKKLIASPIKKTVLPENPAVDKKLSVTPTKINNAKQLINTLSNNSQDVEELKLEVKALRESLSWKVTKPARVIAKILGIK